jgi:hypothetical protein
MLLRNDCAPEAHWLQLQLHAAWGNPQAIGATVTLTANGITQCREVRSGGSYASSSDLRPLFGLGSASRVDRLTIRWPSGQETVLRNVPANELLRIDEPRRR